MKLDILDIKPQKGTLRCNLWENENIGLPLTLFYSIEIPLKPFNSGHIYVPQPTKTDINIDWVNFSHRPDQQNQPNWKNLARQTFRLSYEEENAEGSIYLGTEHCPFNSVITFISLDKTVFEIELILDVDFNIETKNLEKDGKFTIKTQLDFEGFLLYPNSSLPTIPDGIDPLTLISGFIDTTVYQDKFDDYDKPNLNWRHLKPQI